MTGYTLCGLRVTSELALPGLVCCDTGGVPDVTIRLGDVPPLAHARWTGPLLQIGEAGDCRFEVSAVAAYHVDAKGREITIAPHIAADAPDIRTFLFGTVFAIVFFRRGLLPLHASVVCIGKRAVAFSGVSGAGKSTLAAHFMKRGYPVLTDDVAVIAMQDGRAMLQPAFAHIKLWRDAMEGLSLDVTGRVRVRSQLEKYHLPTQNFSIGPQPLSRIYHLAEVSDEQHEVVRPLSGADAFMAMEHAVYRASLGRRLLRPENLFVMAGRVSTCVSSVLLRRVKSLNRMDAVIDTIVAREEAA